MAKASHYSPQIQRFLVCALYHEAQSKRVAMTVLIDRLLANALAGTEGWRKAQEAGHALKLRGT